MYNGTFIIGIRLPGGYVKIIFSAGSILEQRYMPADQTSGA
jgi:hypothetical protein